MSEDLEVTDDNYELAMFETVAVELARGAGAILEDHFGGPMHVEYKGERGNDPVTEADKASEEYLRQELASRFPHHGILGEEGALGAPDLPDYLWVLDPLDGTNNFLNRFPVYCVSIGLVFKGRPVVGSIFVPDPSGGVVYHARRGGGAFREEKKIAVSANEFPETSRLVGMPAYFSRILRFSRKLRSQIGEVRVPGSIAYELALTSWGVFQYSVFLRGRLWDFAAGVVIVREAGGSVLTRRSVTDPWRPLDQLFNPGEVNDVKTLREWTAPLIVGNSSLANFVANNIQVRRFVLRRFFRHVRRLFGSD